MSETTPINQKKLRRFFYQLGFLEAMDWPENKLREMAMSAGKHTKEEQIPGQYTDLFHALQAYAKSGKFITWEAVTRKALKHNEQ